MKIAICDDDWHMQQTLRLFIDQTYQDLDMLVDGFTSGEALLAAVQKQSQPYQLILLDIEMRGIDGIGIVGFDNRDIIRHRLVKHIVEAFEKCGGTEEKP